MASNVQAVPFPGGSSQRVVPKPRPPPRFGAPGGPSAFSLYETIGLFAIPNVCFMAVCGLFMNVFYHSAHIVLMLLAIGVGFCVIEVRRGMLHRTDTWSMFVSAFTLAGLLLSGTVGAAVFERCVAPYRFLHDSNSYVNVLPSEAAEGFGDAGKLLFAEGARVDVERAVGYKDGTVHCVAPIADDVASDRVQFWAVGHDCCGQRGSFSCDDAWNPKARGGIVIDLGDGVSRWDTDFGRAVRQAEAAFNLQSAEQVLFLRWVVDPETVELDYWRVARATVLVSCAVFALLTGVGLGLITTVMKDFVQRLQ
mmetsp:Transcript_94946/g.245203  ORF Transcript_94946/g.245203 Transcript_94946/m.245203 type:complete len:309 (+) Transcript_94946:114-1040(+)